MKVLEGGNGIIEREKLNIASSHSSTSVQHSVDIKSHTPLCVNQMASGRLLKSTGSPARCSVMPWMGEMGVWVGGRLKEEGIYV